MPLKKVEVFNPDNTKETRNRFESLMGLGAMARFEYSPLNFTDSIELIKYNYFSTKE